MSAGTKIKQYRELIGLTQAQLGQRVGTQAQNISKYERDEQRPRYEMQVKIASALGVSVSDLFTEEQQNTAFNTAYSEMLGDSLDKLRDAVNTFDLLTNEMYNKLTLRNKGKVLGYIADLLDVQKLQEIQPDASQSNEIQKIIS